MSALAVIYSRALFGVEAPLVRVEAHISNGLPALSIVGLPETTVRESKERVRSALLNTEFEFPVRRITINLSPADLPKGGGRLDLPIGLSILVASGQISQAVLADYEFLGELALNGEIRGVPGVLSAALACQRAGRKLILPVANIAEASLVVGLELYPAQHISEVCAHLLGLQLILAVAPVKEPSAHIMPELADIKGQHAAKRALEIVAAGGHSLLMVGPPGTGKTLLASRLPGILPSMTDQEAIETAIVYSISQQGFDLKTWRTRPFRSPHHSASGPALVGGSNPPKAGEISLAHHGVLFLDELPEFSRSVIESLREPLEKGCIYISRAAHQCRFPAQFQLIAAMNPCPCGYYGDREQECSCTPAQIQQYRHKISGPFLDRLDLSIEVKRLPAHLLIHQSEVEEPSETVRARVEAARHRQLDRQGVMNAHLSQQSLARLALSKAAQSLIEMALTQMHLSARAYHRTLKVARTIADLAGSELIDEAEIAEALHFRHKTLKMS